MHILAWPYGNHSNSLPPCKSTCEAEGNENLPSQLLHVCKTVWQVSESDGGKAGNYGLGSQWITAAERNMSTGQTMFATKFTASLVNKKFRSQHANKENVLSLVPPLKRQSP